MYNAPGLEGVCNFAKSDACTMPISRNCFQASAATCSSAIFPGSSQPVLSQANL